MEKIIKLPNRYGDNNYLKLMPKVDDSESKTYVLKLSTSYLRTGNVSTNKKFIDPPGGPMIVEGETLAGTNETVKSIDWIKDFGYTITLE